jgi:hypothetical protein
MTPDAQAQARIAASKGTVPGGNVLKKLAPGAPGTKRLSARHGYALVCVRYREDTQTGRRLTTVELVVESRPLPPLPGVRIAYGETELRQRAKAAGCNGDAENKLWRLPKSAIRKLNLIERIVPENA